MENQFFRCTQRAITQRRVITLGPIFIKMVLNQAQGLKEKSPPGSFRVKEFFFFFFFLFLNGKLTLFLSSLILW